MKDNKLDELLSAEDPEDPEERPGGDKMKFEIGQKVIVAKNLGRFNDQERGSYYYGESVKNIPLGSIGIVSRYCDDHYRIRFKKYANICMIGEEIVEYNYKEEQEKLNSKLENALMADEPIAQEEAIYKKRPFESKFNVREEFAVWIRQEFPKLGEYAENDEKYKELIERRSEIIIGARKAYDHAMNTTGGCTKYMLQCHFSSIGVEKNIYSFVSNLEKFVETIEQLSRNLKLH